MKKLSPKYTWLGVILGLLIALFPMGLAARRFGAVPVSEVTPDMLPYFIVSGIGFIVVALILAFSEKQGSRK